MSENNVISARSLAVPQQWEYMQYKRRHMIRALDDTEALNEFGRQGWELVSVVSVTVRKSQEFRYTFKRPVCKPPIK